VTVGAAASESKRKVMQKPREVVTQKPQGKVKEKSQEGARRRRPPCGVVQLGGEELQWGEQQEVKGCWKRPVFPKWPWKGEAVGGGSTG
jgi:hypothetical protein